MKNKTKNILTPEMRRIREIEERCLYDTVLSGYSLSIGDYTLKSSNDSYTYNGFKELVVTHVYGKQRGFNTVKGAMKYMEEADMF